MQKKRRIKKQTRNDVNKDNNCQNIIEKSNDNDVTVGTLFTMLSKRSWWTESAMSMTTTSFSDNEIKVVAKSLMIQETFGDNTHRVS